MIFCPICHKIMVRTYRFNRNGNYVLYSCGHCHIETEKSKHIFFTTKDNASERKNA